jgi:hypothetical protein
MTDSLPERMPQELVGLAIRVQFCHYCYSRVCQVKDIVLSTKDGQAKGSGAVGSVATFYMYNYYSNLSELFSKLKDDQELERSLQSTQEQRVALREKLRHVVVHSVDAEELITAFENDDIFSILWSKELITVSKYVLELMNKYSPAFADSFKQELLDVDKFVQLPGQLESIKQFIEEAHKNQGKYRKALEDEGFPPVP